MTYSGITDAERRAFGIRYNPFDNDTFNTERYGASMVHSYDFNPNLNLRSSFYYNSFSRNWWRQSSRTVDGQCGDEFKERRLHGQVLNPDTCDSIQGRLRDYYIFGFDQGMELDHGISENVGNTIKAGYRLHEEGQQRRRENNEFLTGGSELGELNERDAFAFSFFVQDRVQFGKFSVTPAFRYEDIAYKQRIKLVSDDCPFPPCRGTERIDQFIPGISIGYDPIGSLSLFAGVHRGFAPPRVEDSLADGGSIDVDAEHSVNLEVGFRSEPARGLYLDST